MEILQARVEQKTDTEANWIANPLPLLAGECAFVKGADGTPINFKIGDGTKRFSDLPYWINYAANVVVPTVPPGSTLPNPGSAGKIIILAAGSYTNIGGGTSPIVAPANAFNLYFWNGTTWSLIVSIPISVDLTGYVNKTTDITTALGNQLFDKTVFVNDSQINGFTGAATTSVGSGDKYSSIPIPSGATQLTLSGNSILGNRGYRFVDGSGTLLGSNFGTLPTNPITLSVPVGAVSFQFTWARTGDAGTVGNTIMLNTGASALPYESYVAMITQITGKNIKASGLVDNATMSSSGAGASSIINRAALSAVLASYALTSALPVIVNNIIEGKNRHNPATDTDGFYMENNGTIVANATYGYTDYIRVTAGLPYTGWNFSTGTRFRKTCFFDINHVVVAGGSTSDITTFTVPAGVAYIRATYYIASKASFQIEQSAAATSFTPFVPDIVTLYSVNGAVVPSSSTLKKVNLKNAETDVFFGDSYLMGEYKLKGKHVIQKLSQFSDRRIENYSKSGDTLAAILTRIQTNNPTFHASIGIHDYPAGGYGFIGSWTNDIGSGGSMFNATTMAAYIANLTKLCNAVKSLGFKPVIYGEHTMTTGLTYGALAQIQIAEFCSNNGYDFVDVADVSRLIRGTADYPAHWFGSHPGTRTDSVFWVPLLNYVRSMPRAKSAIKIYRKRDSITVTTLATDLFYQSIEERAKKFKEILIGQECMADAISNYWDDLTTLNTAGTYTNQKVFEYIKLMNNEAVTFPNYSLIECTIDSTDNFLTYFRLYISDPTLIVYIYDWVNQTMVLLSPTVINSISYFLPTDLKNQVLYDKLSFIVYKTSVVSYTLTDVYYEWDGTRGKEDAGKPYSKRSHEAEVLTNPTFSPALTGWTATGTVTPYVPTDGNVPFQAVDVVDLTTANFVSCTVPITSNLQSRKVQIRVQARNKVAPFSSASSYPSASPVTDDTFDFAALGIELKLNSTNTVQFERYVGLHWTEVVVDTVIPAGVSNLTLTIKCNDANTIQGASASVKIES